MFALKNFISIVRPFFVAPFILYVFNLMAVVIDLYIPINIFTIFIVGLLGIPGLIMLILFLFFIL